MHENCFPFEKKYYKYHNVRKLTRKQTVLPRIACHSFELFLLILHTRHCPAEAHRNIYKGMKMYQRNMALNLPELRWIPARQPLCIHSQLVSSKVVMLNDDSGDGGNQYYLFLLVKPFASTIHRERLMSVRHSRSLEGSKAFFTLKHLKRKTLNIPQANE